MTLPPNRQDAVRLRRTRDDAVDDVAGELHRARAETLFRITRALEDHLERLEALREAINRATPATRAERVARFNAARSSALEYRTYLRVQREILGLSTRDLDQRYRVPAPQR
jgi:hypothetical protein